MLFDNIILGPIIDLLLPPVLEPDLSFMDWLRKSIAPLIAAWLDGTVTVAWTNVTHYRLPMSFPVISFALFKSAT